MPVSQRCTPYWDKALAHGVDLYGGTRTTGRAGSSLQSAFSLVHYAGSSEDTGVFLFHTSSGQTGHSAQVCGDVGGGPALRTAAAGPPDGGDVPGAVGLVRQACRSQVSLTKPHTYTDILGYTCLRALLTLD